MFFDSYLNNTSMRLEAEDQPKQGFSESESNSYHSFVPVIDTYNLKRRAT